MISTLDLNMQLKYYIHYFSRDYLMSINEFTLILRNHSGLKYREEVVQ